MVTESKLKELIRDSQFPKKLGNMVGEVVMLGEVVVMRDMMVVGVRKVMMRQKVNLKYMRMCSWLTKGMYIA